MRSCIPYALSTFSISPLNRFGRLKCIFCTAMDLSALSTIHAVLWSPLSIALSMMVHRRLNCFLAWCVLLLFPSSSWQMSRARFPMALSLSFGMMSLPTYPSRRKELPLHALRHSSTKSSSLVWKRQCRSRLMLCRLGFGLAYACRSSSLPLLFMVLVVHWALCSIYTS